MYYRKVAPTPYIKLIIIIIIKPHFQRLKFSKNRPPFNLLDNNLRILRPAAINHFFAFFFPQNAARVHDHTAISRPQSGTGSIHPIFFFPAKSLFEIVKFVFQALSFQFEVRFVSFKDLRASEAVAARSFFGVFVVWLESVAHFLALASF